MQYITAYQGALNNTALGNLAVTGTTTSTLIVGTLPAIDGTVTSSTVVFYAGDFVQPENSRYPYSVTQTVVRGTGTTISVPLNRPIITSENITLTGNKVLVGNSVTWRVIVGALPTYTLIPFRKVQYNGAFDLIEKVI
jgi:nitrogen fixation protein